MFDWKRYNLRKLNEMKVKKQYKNKLETLSDGAQINRAWENAKRIKKPSVKGSLVLKELKQPKLCFDEDCLGFF
jgi:hypothetical protein